MYQDGELKINEKSLRVYRHGKEIKLAKKEFELLLLLVRNRSAVISRDRILSEVWHMSDEVETRTVDAHVRNLRKKIGPERIATVVGFGYRYDPPQEG
jgi:DNA-binding response OmpR family regulator